MSDLHGEISKAHAKISVPLNSVLFDLFYLILPLNLLMTTFWLWFSFSSFLHNPFSFNHGRGENQSRLAHIGFASCTFLLSRLAPSLIKKKEKVSISDVHFLTVGRYLFCFFGYLGKLNKKSFTFYIWATSIMLKKLYVVSYFISVNVEKIKQDALKKLYMIIG